MRLETFFNKFEELADTTDAMESLREVVLQLAVRGKLTEQADDESSQSQLCHAEAFRIRRGRRGEPDSDDVPFPVPANWGWVAIGDSMGMVNGKAFKPEDWSADGTPIIRIQNLNNEGAPFNRCKADLDPKFHVRDGSMLISWSGTPGTSFGAFIWTRGFAYLNQHIFRCELVKGVFVKEFLRLAVNARLDEMISHAQGAVGLRHITKGKLENIRLPLPPLAEQKRIVAKVDELMALCDRLEALQQERETRHAALARASLARFADAPTPANLQFLFHSSFIIPPSSLRKSILTLAVQGKLVPQDPNDEDAEVLLQRVDAEREQLAKSKKIRRQDLLGPVADGAIPFDIPASWQWRYLADVCFLITDGAHHTPQYLESGVPFLSVRDVSGGTIDFSSTRYISEEAHQELCKRCPPALGDILLTKIGTTGIAVTVDEDREFSIFVSLALLKFSQTNLDGRYLMHLINSPFVKQQSADNTQGIGNKNLVLRLINRFTIAIPPLAEQRRIVAKVDQLMALVDELETQLAASRATAANLLSALVAELTGTPSVGKVSVSSASTTGRRGRPPKS